MADYGVRPSLLEALEAMYVYDLYTTEKESAET